MLLWIISFLRGYLIIEAHGFFIERFINLCIRQKIYLWDISKDKSHVSRMKISTRAFKRIRHAAFQSKTRVRIVKRCGLPLLLLRHRRRKAFFAGALVFILLLAFLTSFIWSVEISGAEKIDENELRKQLGTCGVSVGVIKYGHSPSQIKEKMLLLNESLSWIWVDIRGTKAYVEVKTRHETPQMVALDDPCNIVATRDGVIRDYIVKSGQSVVEVGDVVKSGQLLISGAVDSPAMGARLFHSEAEVTAITWYDKTDIYPLSMMEERKTGNLLKRHTISFGNFDLNLFKDSKIPYTAYNKESFEKQIKLWGDVVLPVTYKCETYYETVSEDIPLTEAEAVKKYGDELYESIKEEIGNSAHITNRQITHILREDNTAEITCHVECVENIGKKVPIAKEETGDTKDF